MNNNVVSSKDETKSRYIDSAGHDTYRVPARYDHDIYKEGSNYVVSTFSYLFKKYNLC